MAPIGNTGSTDANRQAMRGGLVITTAVAAQSRKDLHNSSVDFAAAIAGKCGFTHVPTGRACLLPYRHAGLCELHSQVTDVSPNRTSDDANPAADITESHIAAACRLLGGS
jgi:hypothetical protein